MISPCWVCRWVSRTQWWGWKQLTSTLKKYRQWWGSADNPERGSKVWHSHSARSGRGNTPCDMVSPIVRQIGQFLAVFPAMVASALEIRSLVPVSPSREPPLPMSIPDFNQQPWLVPRFMFPKKGSFICQSVVFQVADQTAVPSAMDQKSQSCPLTTATTSAFASAQLTMKLNSHKLQRIPLGFSSSKPLVNRPRHLGNLCELRAPLSCWHCFR